MDENKRFCGSQVYCRTSCSCGKYHDCGAELELKGEWFGAVRPYPLKQLFQCTECKDVTII